MNRSKEHKKKKREEAKERDKRFKQTDVGKKKYGTKNKKAKVIKEEI